MRKITPQPAALPPASTLPAPRASRRHTLQSALLGLLGAVATPFARGQARASATVLPQMMEGPYYPPAAWRAASTDWDADLTQVRQDNGPVLTAQGEHLALTLLLRNPQGQAVSQAEVEIWQCDAFSAYRHPDVTAPAHRQDPGFQGFGAARSGADGSVRFRTIRPVAYPGRAPHIHIRLRHPSFGEWTSQLFVSGDPKNDFDLVWRRLQADDRVAADLPLQAIPAAGNDGLQWQVSHTLVMPEQPRRAWWRF